MNKTLDIRLSGGVTEIENTLPSVISLYENLGYTLIKQSDPYINRDHKTYRLYLTFFKGD